MTNGSLYDPLVIYEKKHGYCVHPHAVDQQQKAFVMQEGGFYVWLQLR